MNFLRKLGLRTKIALPFIVAIVSVLIVGSLSVTTSRNLVADSDYLAENLLPAVSEVLNADRDLYQALVAQMAYINFAEGGQVAEQHQADFHENADQALERMANARLRLGIEQGDSLVQGFQRSFDDWRSSAVNSMALARNGDARGARALLSGESDSRFGELRDYYDKVGAFADEQAQELAKQASAEGQQSAALTVTITLAAVLIGAILFFMSSKLVAMAINQIRRRLDEIAEGEGDLTQRIPVEVNDDLGRLSESFNKVLANLQTMIRTIQQLSEQLADGAHQLDREAADNRDGVAKQTDAIAMVAAAINEMQSAIEEVAGNASTAADATQQARQNGEKGAVIVRKSSGQVHQLAAQISKGVDVIRALSKDSDNISSVLDVIRDIADQTNLLALNAAIEAARAGEQGRGFSVVADEVRTLAKRTQKSTEDIQVMVTALQGGVADVVSVMEVGSKQAQETEKLAADAEVELNAILGAMNDLADVNASVASATEEQTQVVDEINRSVIQINDLATEGASRSATIDEIGKSLAHSAEQLNSQAARFKV
ncbi:methyl-accepting chemotaxis protein [Marinobacter salicampi]|uniref:methyl-accepting chemotaxis protein n=1 Tax=Marinobacter salicampi TaxID=435907 RepID=UPI00140D3152|nr:methyl-accepting chemotaxis protein [Marinobacter salicampi]